MPSPFPGMDPFIESQKWTDFHTSLITTLREQLLPLVRPKYYVDVEERVYVERDPDDFVRFLRPDVSVSDAVAESPCVYGGAATMVVPVDCLVPLSDEVSESYLTLRRKATRSVVTVIELLSPTNKRPGANGYDQYQEKRRSVLASCTNLVELDLLRGGRRMPILGQLPPGDYRVLVARHVGRPRGQVYVWPLEQRLPAIPIPLAQPDPDVMLDLQNVFNLVYDRSGYDYSLDYDETLAPPLDAAGAEWVRRVLCARTAS